MKKLLLFLLIPMTLLLSGCSSFDTLLEDAILSNSGIFEQEDYKIYQQFLQEGTVDESGNYSQDALPDAASATLHNEAIHVTFAENRYLSMKYYSNAEMTELIDVQNCYLSPGDTIYGVVFESDNPNSNHYALSECRVYEYTGSEEIKNTHILPATDDSFLYQIPENYSGSDLSIVPVGNYADRELQMEAFYYDENGNKQLYSSAGEWYVNGDPCDGSSTSISSVKPYTLKFFFDTANYFYVESTPACFTPAPNSTGYIEFREADPTDTDQVYSVELSKYIAISVQCAEGGKYRLNNGTYVDLKKNGSFAYDDLVFGDVITIETSGPCTITGGDYQHIDAAKDPIMNGYRYKLTVTRKSDNNISEDLLDTVAVERTFIVTLDSSGTYGTCSYELDGRDVSGTIPVIEGQVLKATYMITADGYTFAEATGGFAGSVHDFFLSSERTKEITVTAELDGTEIRPDNLFEVIAKED